MSFHSLHRFSFVQAGWFIRCRFRCVAGWVIDCVGHEGPREILLANAGYPVRQHHVVARYSDNRYKEFILLRGTVVRSAPLSTLAESTAPIFSLGSPPPKVGVNVVHQSINVTLTTTRLRPCTSLVMFTGPATEWSPIAFLVIR
jgi:hypothetical protein